MTIYRGLGGGGDATTDAEINILTALTNQAIAASTASGASATQSATSATNSATSASGAATSASSASGSASTATTQATNASGSASAASTSASNASTSASNAAASAASVVRDGSGGVVGLTLFKVNMRNVLNTLTSFFTNSNTLSRTYTLPDKDGTVAMVSDITGTNSGTNTGDQTISLTGGVTGSGTGSFVATVVTNANLTGVITSVGNTTSLGSFTSAQLAAALTNETGSGSNVFSTSPTLVTPVLGAASATSLTFNDLSVQNTAATGFGFKNTLINGDFRINQRSVSGTVVLAAGVYGHDRFKAGSVGCTYTFATSVNVTTITISAGSLIQVIEGVNLQSGTYSLSWTGTVQGKINSGSYAASGVTGTATGGTNLNVEFNIGTLSFAQLEKGSTATSFDYRDYGRELSMCQRYEWRVSSSSVPVVGAGYFSTTTALDAYVKFPVSMRAPPTVTAGGATNPLQVINTVQATASLTATFQNSNDSCLIRATAASASFIANQAGLLCVAGGGAWLDFNSEL